MLSPKAQYNMANAKQYFEDHLRVGDYYGEGQQVLGHWYRQGAEELGLSPVTRGDDSCACARTFTRKPASV